MFRQFGFYNEGSDEPKFEYDTTDFMNPASIDIADHLMFLEDPAMEDDTTSAARPALEKQTPQTEQKNMSLSSNIMTTMKSLALHQPSAIHAELC